MMGRWTPSLLWTLFAVIGCDAGRGAPRLVPAPPLPASGVVIDLGEPAELEPPPEIFCDPRIDASLVLLMARGAPLFEVALEAPRADGATLPTILEVAPSRCIGPASVLDLSARANADLDATLEVADIEAFEKTHGRIRADEFVVLRTDYDVQVPNLRDPQNAYTTAAHAPGFSLAAMRFLVLDRGVRRIVTDTPFLSAAVAKERAVEELLYGRGGFSVTRLVGLSRLPPRGATIVAMPLALPARSWAPARVVAIVPR